MNLNRSLRLLLRLLVPAALGAGLLGVGACKTPPQDRDTNQSKYNYSYNR
ncbi:MAG TPA: hypothetical protein PKC43_09115 [Phycisphaerales bacterium]|nr:hypothetical protein [Phycisphaerales bacterium]HMP37595.1 hypothetical protein [Phycisphaerales bacterium]